MCCDQRFISRRLVVLVAAFSVTILPTAGLAGSPALDAGEPPDHPLVLEDQAEAIIRATYERLVRYVAASGYKLELELDEFTTYGLPQLDGVRWFDLVTMPGGDMIDMVRRDHVLGDDYQSYTTVRYEPSWQLDAPDFMFGKEAESRRDIDARRAIEQAAKGWSLLANVRAVTSYRVRVDLEGRTRDYRAVFIWLPAMRPQRAEFMALDLITQGVDAISREQAPPANELPTEILRLEPEPGLQKTSCLASTHNDSDSAQKSDSAGHADGAHRGAATYRSRCTCSSSCELTCEAWVDWHECTDWGTRDMCHKMASNVNGSTYTTALGATQGIGCAAGVACAQTPCLFCMCSLSASVSISGLGVSFGFSGNPGPAWVFSHAYQYDCAPCMVDAPSDPPDDSPLPEGPGTPIVFDLGKPGFRFTDVAGGVRFDQDADGFREPMAWTDSGPGDAFLVLDRNGNGTIDDGTELFGDTTSQPPSELPNGFLALAVFDQTDEGGDGDGWITPLDAVFGSLRLWTDANHDGVSQGSEMVPLSQVRVDAIDLEYRESRRRDRHGNLLRYQGRAYLQGHGHLPVVDVFLLKGLPD